MTIESTASEVRALGDGGKLSQRVPEGGTVPVYLERIYWWAYVRPWAIRIFERQWLIDLILWGWYDALREAALTMMGECSGRTLQIACAYGNLTPRLYERVWKCGGQLDVVDVVEAQLHNLQRKLPLMHEVRCLHRDSSCLSLPDAAYDRALIFFLMHEQPEDVRRKTLDEAFRVVKPGGCIVITEFAKPKWWHPLRHIYLPLLKFLEPFAPDIWSHENVASWLSAEHAAKVEQRHFLFGHYYQVLRIRVEPLYRSAACSE